MPRIPLLLGLALFLGAESRSQESWTLEKCYEAALKRSESLLIGQAELDQATARLRQLRGATLPQISLRLSEQIQDSSGEQGGVAGTFLNRSRPEAKIHLGQALFSGFQDLALLAAAKAQRKVEQEELEAARRALGEDLARAFYTALDRGKNLESLEELQRLTQDRLRELKGRVSLGRSRKSELISIELQLRNIQADQAGANKDFARAGEMLAYFLGQKPTVFEEGKTPDEKEQAEFEGWAAHLDKRPDIQALEARRISADRGLAAARRARWPLIRAEGNYFLHRTGIQENVDWDGLLTLDWPLFSGGSARARMDEAKAQGAEAEARFSQAKRKAGMDCLGAWEDLRASLESLRAYSEAQRLAEENYSLQAADYRLGLATNLEVLAALNQLHESRRNLDRARVQVSLDFFLLRAVSGAPLFGKELP